jgi:hypothetical protein
MSLTPEQEILRLAVRHKNMFMPFPTITRIESSTPLGREKIRIVLRKMENEGLLREAPYQPRNKRVLEVTEAGEAEIAEIEA